MRGQSAFNGENGSALEMSRGKNSVSRRTAHGSSAWTLPVGAHAMRQPQDGSQAGMVGAARALLTTIRQNNPFAEPEDAKITGGTRSLARRLLGLNVTAAPRKAPISALSAMAKRQAA